MKVSGVNKGTPTGRKSKPTRWVGLFVLVLISGFMSSLALAQSFELPEELKQANTRNVDPWEGLNRKTHAFNEFFDRWLLKPAAQSYQFITPQFVDNGVTNFFRNIDDINNMINSLLQGKIDRTAVDASRFLLNTTVGLVGLIDVATWAGLERQNEDFGQTLGVWGVESGPYLVIPLLGPSTVRDGIGRMGDTGMDPRNLIDDVETRLALSIISTIDLRADAIKVEGLVTGDRYIFLRDAYLQKRAYDIRDGEAAPNQPSFGEDDFGGGSSTDDFGGGDFDDF